MTAPLRVAIDARRAAWMGHTGIGRYVAGLLGHAHHDPRIRFTGLLAAGQQPVGGDVDWLRMRLGLSAASRLAWEQLAEPYAVQRSHARVLHLPWYEGAPAPGVPLVLTIQDLASLDPQAVLPRTFAYYNGLLRMMAPRARRVIVPSRATALAVGSLGIAEDRVRVIPYGHDARLVNVRSAGPCLGETRTILYCGGYGARKRLDVLLDAMPQVLAARPDAELVLVGSVPGDVLRRVRRLGLDERVRVPGRISDDELRELYMRADACAYPSAHEGFGFPALEALTAGVPLVAVDASSIPEIAGDVGWLRPAGDVDAFAQALIEVLQAGPTVAERVARGLDRAREFSWSACLIAHADVYLEAAFG